MEKVETVKIRPFDGSNFANWSYRVKAHLKTLRLGHCIERAAEEEPFWNFPADDAEAAAKRVLKERRIEQDDRCMDVLIQCIADSHLEHVKDRESPKEIWDGLVAVFERKSTTNRFLLKKQLLTMKFDERESLQDHLLNFDRLVRDLKSAGARMDEEDKICHLMLTMPESYETVTTAMGVMSDQLTMDVVRRNYLDFEAKQKGKRADQEAEDSAFASSSKPKFKCFSCGGIGHKKSQCPKRNDKKPEQRKKPDQKANLGAKTVSFVAEEVAAVSPRADSRWYLDSGASEHMSNDKTMFESLQELKEPVVIQTAKAGTNLLARHKGRVTVQAMVSGEEIEVTMDDVLFIPELTLNLLSLRRLENSGKKVVFYEGKVFVDDDGDVVATGRRFGKLYAMDFRRSRSGGQAMVSGRVCRKLELWHHRFGHLGNENLLKLVRRQMVDGLDLAEVENGAEKVICESCIAGKQTREPFRKSAEKRTRRPLELVHSDVCGPITPETWDGKAYFVSFIDDYTHLAVVYLLKTKDEVLEKFAEYEAMATAHFGERISRLRCDNGGEYTGHAMRNFCKRKGIQLETTVPYTPEQNGKSERFNRTFVEKVRAMLTANGLPKNLWGEAVYTATYVLNRSPSVAVEGDVTPYEAWQGRKPDVSNLRVFGCDCYVHVPKQRRKKLDSKTEKVQFVGYAPTGCRVWNGRKVFIARDVVFNEEELVFAKVEEKDNSASEEGVVVIESVVPSVQSVPPVKPVPPEESDDESEYDTGEESSEEGSANPGPEGNPDPAPEGGPDPVPEGPQGEGGELGKRIGRPPGWHRDFDMTAFALCAEEYVDEIPSSVSELRKREDWLKWEQAIQEELTSLAKNDTWRLVAPPDGARIIDNKWVFKVKRNGEGAVERFKARLVARGFTQREGFDFSETYSPVAKMTTLRILLALANQEGWHLHQMDVKCAFLNGLLDEDIYMCQPPGFERGKNLVCKLNRAIYGLKQSSRNWNRRFDDYVTKLGYKRCQHDLCLYHWKAEGVVVYMLIYVDDILIAGNDLRSIRKLKGKLSTEFEMKDMEEAKTFLGLRIGRDKKAGLMTIDQKAYTLGVLKRFGMENCKPSPVPMQPRLKIEKGGDPKEFTNKPYKELVGCLMYLTVTSRPDICTAVNYFASFQSSATEEHWVHLKRVLRYLQGTLDYKLVYQRADSATGVEAFADADWGNDSNDRKSVSGFVLKLHGQTVNWSTRKQTSVALSSTEAELMSLCQASCEVMWTLNLLQSIEYEVPHPVIVYEDNQPCISVTADPRKLKRMKHIDVQYRFVKELIDNGKLRLEYLSTEEQVADLMTKGLAAPRFRKLREMLGIAN